MANRCVVPFDGICTPAGAPLSGYTDIDTGERFFFSQTGVYNGQVVSCLTPSGNTGGGGLSNDTNSISSVAADFVDGSTGFSHDPGDGSLPQFIPILSTPSSGASCNSVRLFEDGLVGRDTDTIAWTYTSDNEVCPIVNAADVECVDRWVAPNNGCIDRLAITLPVRNDASATVIDADHSSTVFRLHSDLQGIVATVTLNAGTTKTAVPLSRTFTEGECFWIQISTGANGIRSPHVQVTVEYEFTAN